MKHEFIRALHTKFNYDLNPEIPGKIFLDGPSMKDCIFEYEKITPQLGEIYYTYIWDKVPLIYKPQNKANGKSIKKSSKSLSRKYSGKTKSKTPNSSSKAATKILVEQWINDQDKKRTAAQ